MSDTRFHGVWSLAEWTVSVVGEEEPRRPYGGEVDGYLFYSRESWVSATLMARGRPKLSEDRFALNGLRKQLLAGDTASLGGKQVELLADYFIAAHGYVTYCGPFDIDERKVHHHVQASLLPQWIGTTLDRVFTFNEDASELLLSAEQPGYTDQLRWQRER